MVIVYDLGNCRSARLLCSWDLPFWRECWSCHSVPPGDLPNPRLEHTSPVAPALQADYFTTEATGKPQIAPTDTAESGSSICVTQFILSTTCHEASLLVAWWLPDVLGMNPILWAIPGKGNLFQQFSSKGPRIDIHWQRNLRSR